MRLALDFPIWGVIARTARRFGWGVADQVLSSLTNFALGLLVARTVTPGELGAFGLAFATYMLALGTSRALAAEPLLVRYSSKSEVAWRKAIRSSTGMAITVGIVSGGACLVAGFALSGRSAGAFLTLGFLLPGLLLQDCWRFCFFAGNKGSKAFLNDLVWAVILFPAVGILLWQDRASIGWLIFAWGGAGSFAALAGLAQARAMPTPREVFRWLREQRDLAPRFLLEFMVSTGSGQLAVFGIGAVAGLSEVGVLRAGQLLLGPLNVLFLGTNLVAVPEAVRQLDKSSGHLRRASSLLSLTLCVAALTWGAMAFLLPDRVGTALLGQSWEGGHSVVIPLAAAAASFGLVIGAGSGLRSLAAARRSLRARYFDAAMGTIAGFGGAALAGAAGAAWGYALVGFIRVPVWWSQFRAALREHESRPSGQYQSSQTPPANKRY